MPSLTIRKGSRNYYFRARLPAAVRDHLSSLPATTLRPAGWSLSECWKSLGTPDRALARQRYAEALATFETECARILAIEPARANARIRCAPVDLSHRQTVALAGTLYDDFVTVIGDDPTPINWKHVQEADRSAKDGHHGLSGLLLANEDERRSSAMSARFGALADAIAARNGLRLTDASRARLIEQTASALEDATKTLARNAAGDYSPDPAASRFPPWTPPQKGSEAPQTAKGASPGTTPPDATTRPSTGSTTWSVLVASWALEAKPTAKTLSARNGIVSRLIKELPAASAGPDSVSELDAIAYKNALLAGGLSPRTVQACHLSGLKALYEHGLANKLVVSNPFAAVRLTGHASRQARRSNIRKEGITDVEAATILRAALADRRPAYRWLPWLAAFTGARITELCQLRFEDIEKIDNVPCLRIRPEAGSTKTDAGERLVPLHDQILEMDFLSFVESVGRGPLFFDAARQRIDDRSTATTSPAKKLGERLSAWVRSLSAECPSLADPRLQPNHGWRHRFVGLRRRYGLDHELAEYLIGHVLPGMGNVYGGQHVEGLKREVDKLPRFEIRQPD
ncbi:DUF6538 domain-containing protein [Beijerinckia mobilis]|uniref:DUF6538 domain-containing protein n=1 Tax=Beijerinckia mobilis TaxID=231434 RepID=UPI00146FECFB|nr:DUF6538 domain-containing protein [Beijerinckia mobilis]